VCPWCVLSLILSCIDLRDHIPKAIGSIETPQWHNKGNFNVLLLEKMV
jgi:hypothetical protein